MKSQKTPDESISKDEAVKKLKEKGFNAFLDNGVVCTTWNQDGKDNTLFQRFQKAARDLGYKASIGIIPVTKNPIVNLPDKPEKKKPKKEDNVIDVTLDIY